LDVNQPFYNEDGRQEVSMFS